MPDFSVERDAIAAGRAPVCGVDEAGRGPLAGPVVAAAVILDADRLDEPQWRDLDDSKRMTAAARGELFDSIRSSADVGIGIADVDQIDILNILGATMKAMADAVGALKTAPRLALVDGNRLPVLNCEARCVVKGDGTSLSIAAASVVAKVTRDRMMTELAARHPGYGWETNAGYGTREHLDALTTLGVTEHHRRSFAPVREALAQTSD